MPTAKSMLCMLVGLLLELIAEAAETERRRIRAARH